MLSYSTCAPNQLMVESVKCEIFCICEVAVLPKKHLGFLVKTFGLSQIVSTKFTGVKSTDRGIGALTHINLVWTIRESPKVWTKPRCERALKIAKI